MSHASFATADEYFSEDERGESRAGQYPRHPDQQPYQMDSFVSLQTYDDDDRNTLKINQRISETPTATWEGGKAV